MKMNQYNVDNVWKQQLKIEQYSVYVPKQQHLKME